MTCKTRFAMSTILVAAMPAMALAATDETTTGADSKELKAEEVGDFVALSGVVLERSGETFKLDYGTGEITVEMDDYDSFADNPLVKGDTVTVRGRMDEDFFDKHRIEASSVHVDSLDTTFYANAADEELGLYLDQFAGLGLNDEELISVSGYVESLGKNDGFTLDLGLKNVGVDASEVTAMPNLKAGDRVLVIGEMDDADLFESREILANDVTETSS